MVTRVDAPALTISAEYFDDIGIAARRAMLPMVATSGNAWMLENANK